VLLVDDEAPLRRIAERILEAAGYQVTAVGSGEEALAHLFGRGAPDLLVTDVVMPKMSGRELAQQVRREHPELQVLYVSGYPGRFRPGPSESFLGKPFDRRALLDAVASALGERQARSS
jgi:CheY-like chemotaxis protein